ncbi:EAL domain-containing protein [Desulfurobacterium thermolithotrophum]|uniref:EAL domain-containing protein n=1 Tax=Desulfurobacterium thermolithotrophum TaxID=64160 RepID=UPI0013D12BCE|nr:EAL domain-containing protein [Desulfurobacterium thermolithotrophum]
MEILKLLDLDDLFIYFQPVIFTKRKKVIGFEALARGKKDKKIISPIVLFELAEKKGIKVELDRLCRKIAFKEFKKFYHQNPNLMLFFNFDGSVIDLGVKYTGFIFRVAKENNISPSNVVIEVTESEVKDSGALKDFVENYRKLGFLIALDDVGIEHSNLNRIAELKPDILKIDRTLIKGINKEEYKSKVVKALAYMAKEIGSLTLAEGVETEKELLKTMRLGIDLHQGFYFSKPQFPTKVFIEKELKDLQEKIADIDKLFHSLVKESFQKRETIHQRYKEIVMTYIKKLKNSKEEEFEKVLEKLVLKEKEIECLYILDSKGTMITRTVFYPKISLRNSPLFRPASSGENLCHREYVHSIVNGNSSFFITTEPYVSLATGNKIITASCKLKASNGKNFILCIDFKAKDLESIW